MKRGRGLLGATLSALLVIGAAETVARAARPNYAEFDSYHEPRNLHYARGWPEYTAPPATPRAADERLVIVITNSQGFLRERADGHEAWPAVLEAELRSTGASARVLNWAIPGGAGAEMTILAARALEHAPDLVLLVSYNDNFGRFWRRKPLSFSRTDATLLAYLPSVRERLEPEFLRATGGWDWLGLLGARSGLVWWRNRLAEGVTDWSFVAVEPRTLGPRESERVAISPITDFPLLDDFTGVLRRGGTRGMLVAMPLCRATCDGWERAAAFANRAAELAAQDSALSAHDATGLIADEDFYGPRHMRPQGHLQFVRWLTPRVLDALTEGR